MDKKRIIESLLFTNSKPLSIEKISSIIEEDEENTRKIISSLQMEYETSDHAMMIIEIANGFQMVTKPIYSEWIKKLFKIKQMTRLSRAALETLAIIAYRQPITRLEIESIRGVNAAGILQHLLEKRLIRIRGRKRTIGRPLLYETTQEFLEYFGLKDLSEMPRIEEIKEGINGDYRTQKVS
jgi:segregation and condensation protein B